MRTKVLLSFLLLTRLIFADNNFININTMNVGPNTVYKEYIETSKPWAVYVLEADVTNTNVKMETVTANDRMTGLEVLSSMVNRNNTENHNVIGAINGDFFSSSAVLNAQGGTR